MEFMLEEELNSEGSLLILLKSCAFHIIEGHMIIYQTGLEEIFIQK
jgi:hypothetical protein